MACDEERGRGCQLIAEAEYVVMTTTTDIRSVSDGVLSPIIV